MDKSEKIALLVKIDNYKNLGYDMNISYDINTPVEELQVIYEAAKQKMDTDKINKEFLKIVELMNYRFDQKYQINILNTLFNTGT